MADWTETHRPRTLAEVRGNDKACEELREWATTWDDHRKPVILHGSPGVGKTSAAHALAADLGWETVELNASDQRTADVIERFAGRATKNVTLTSAGNEADTGRQLVILDEADNLHGTVDRGGTRAIGAVARESGQPIVMIANEYYEMSDGLRNAAETIEFRDLQARSIVPILREVCRAEGIEFEGEALKAIAEAAAGDARSAINDLQTVAEGAERLTADDVMTGDRDRTQGIFEFLDALIKEEDARSAREMSFAVDETPEDLIQWIDENVPKDYAGAELADAYRSLSTADRWLGRVRATQNYSYWRYAAGHMTAGVAAARREPKGGWTRYGPPSYWSKLGRSSGTRTRRDRIAGSIAAAEDVSIGTARGEILPYLSTMTHHCKPRELTVAMAARYDLDADDVSFITGSGASTNKVQGIVEEAEELREETAAEASGLFDEAQATDGDGDDEAESSDEVATDESEEGGETGRTPGADGEMNGAAEEDDKTDEERDADDGQTGLGDFT